MSRDDPTPPRILIVEDEALVAMLIEDVVSDLGYLPVGPFARVDHALAAVIAGEADGAVLDVNLAGERSYPVADELARRGLPFLFVTGYGEGGLEPAYREYRVVEKPFATGTLEQAIAQFAFA